MSEASPRSSRSRPWRSPGIVGASRSSLCSTPSPGSRASSPTPATARRPTPRHPRFWPWRRKGYPCRQKLAGTRFKRPRTTGPLSIFLMLLPSRFGHGQLSGVLSGPEDDLGVASPERPISLEATVEVLATSESRSEGVIRLPREPQPACSEPSIAQPL